MLNKFFCLTKKYADRYPKRFGTLLALTGVIVLTPDTMIMRMSGLESWPLVGWRGVLSGFGLIFVWKLFSSDLIKDLKSLFSFPSLIVIICFGLNSITFTLGIQETSVMVVLTALATMPIFAAVLSAIFMKERQGFFGWLAIVLVLIGISVVVKDGNNATGQPGGSVLLGAIYGAITAFGLAVTFTIARKYQKLSILLAAAVGSIWSGLFGFYFSSYTSIFTAPLWTLISMGFLILPLSFACLSIAPKYTTSAIVSLIMLLEMVIGPFWVWLGIGETPSNSMLLGSLIVLIVLALHIRRTQFN